METSSHLEMLTVLLMSRRSKGLGDLDTAGVERGESSLMSQYSSLMSGVDCLLPGHEFSSPLLLSPILLSVFLENIVNLLTNVNLQTSSSTFVQDLTPRRRMKFQQALFEKTNPSTISQLIIGYFGQRTKPFSHLCSPHEKKKQKLKKR